MATKSFEAKQQVFALLRDMPALAKAQVTYGHPPADIERRAAMVGKVEWDRSEWATNKSREEDFRISVRFLVFILAGSSRDAETELQGLCQDFEDAVKANPGLGMTGIVTTSCAPVEMDSAPAEGGWVAGMDYELRVVARV